MDDPTARWHSTLHIALLHPTRAALLMQPEGGAWALPQVQGEGRMPLRQVAFTNQMMAQVFGVHTTVLRYLDVRETSGHLEAIGLLEAHPPTWEPPPGWQWMADSDLATIPLQVPQHRIPEAIVHGDLYLGNIASPQGHALFFDWTDGCVSHPFLDPVVMQSDAQRLPDAAEMAVPLCQAYLAPWADVESMPRLYDAWRLAEPLGALHQAMNYYRITTRMDVTHSPELTGGLQFWLRQVLRAWS